MKEQLYICPKYEVCTSTSCFHNIPHKKKRTCTVYCSHAINNEANCIPYTEPVIPSFKRSIRKLHI